VNTKPKVLMIQRIFPNYRRSTYDKLAENFDFQLLHGDDDAAVNLAVAPYSKIFKGFQYSKNQTHVLFNGFTTLFKFKPKAVIHESSIGMLTLLPMYVCCKLMGIKFILYGHGYNRFTGFNPSKNWGDKFRVFLMSVTDATTVYTQTNKNRMTAYVPENKVFVAQNTLDSCKYRPILHHLEQEGRDSVKQKLGFTHKFNLIYIGRVVAEKMPDRLLDIFEILQQKMPNQVGIHFVGGGETEPLEQTVVEKNWQNHITFHGWVHDADKTGAFLYASDMMLMPGNVGLAVNHAFMFDCPVISFLQTEFGPPEIEYIVDHKTGFLIPDFSTQLMADTIYKYLQNEDLQKEMKRSIRQKMDTELTLDNMVKGFTDAVAYVLNKDNITEKE
jgi:glycosyltransferase involved in cell wall biosynthesis